MMDVGKRRAIELVVCLAIVIHLLLFMAIPPANKSVSMGVFAPTTHYLVKEPNTLSMTGIDIRTLWSPVLFSLPSKMGFSRDLLKDDLRTKLSFSQPVETERFLKVDSVSRNIGAQIMPQELMLTGGSAPSPRLPVETTQSMGKRPSARRVYVGPELQERLLGGVVLPPELNKETDAPWDARADVSISEQGRVQHLFLEQPLESAKLNFKLIQMLYGLRFRPADHPVEGSIEIFSPESMRDGGLIK